MENQFVFFFAIFLDEDSSFGAAGDIIKRVHSVSANSMDEAKEKFESFLDENCLTSLGSIDVWSYPVDELLDFLIRRLGVSNE